MYLLQFGITTSLLLSCFKIPMSLLFESLFIACQYRKGILTLQYFSHFDRNCVFILAILSSGIADMSSKRLW